jgi:DNA-binding CsgD family transcriptional regulator
MAPPDPLARLSEDQRTCLRLVFRHKSSKDIARLLGISSHTVDQSLKRAIRLLGVQTRVEAALLLARHEGNGSDQPLVYQAQVLPDPSDAGPPTAPDDRGNKIRPASVLREERAPYGASPSSETWAAASGHPVLGGRRNDLTILKRLGWIFAIAIGSAFAFGAILSGLDALGRLS